MRRAAIRKLSSPYLVQESGQHGGTASGPVVRDVIKAYYDKKNKKTKANSLPTEHSIDPAKNAPAATAIQPQPILKQQGQPQTVPARAKADRN